jgi:Fur family transcriptional regulator, ferric uptake regulator
MDELGRVLRDHGYRVTRPRRAVWAVLGDADEHLTVEQIVDELDQRGAEVDLASVYRTLGLLEEIGLARTSRLGDSGASHWEIAHPDEHFHLVCEECGAVDHHVGSLVAQIREHLAGDHGFEVHDVELVVSGRCRRCAARQAS